MKNKSCSFFGHRNTVLNNKQLTNLKKYIEELIIKKNVQYFLFGSRSDFNNICHSIVSELKNKYSNIQRIFYTCRSESCILENERKYWEEIYFKYYKEKVTLLGFEKEREYKTKYTSNKASYIERNYAIIDDSDYCVFYYDENYKPNLRKYSKRNMSYYQPNSGTALAYLYAKRQNKKIVNLF